MLKKYKIEDYVTDVVDNGVVYTAREQKEKFETLITGGFSEDGFVYLLSCEQENYIPKTLGKIIYNCLVEANKNVYWFNLLDRKEDSRLEDYENEMGIPDALIIDGLFAKTNINHIDKVRALISMYSNLPIFVIVSGTSGVDMFQNQVFVKYDGFLHFSKNKKIKRVI
jgi:hypothetical protein